MIEVDVDDLRRSPSLERFFVFHQEFHHLGLLTVVTGEVTIRFVFIE